ncbi:hypothetical protein SERLA73DRAFT_180699 [Serpula lacrymans var. lacrymans S7.3]|uniref:Uncharacterized protein n=2 Tax=Serpula lacrymans var. lacrymans TaxID=341189 RepID=F8PW53_SERL3|nr:uncharacterized protein SERLADRAFT_466403 [Serpula lacrymans var. lacrymans S7.9]EGO00229.1 hypothetical protein SERLA73DRAFT_180699 [Serpula lacrymans var. lacrymans S7.3]EGO25787.1 hypothetical protein SERLADRAFT_466403 [Serpula lacrymans var. lacrymans S7.9]
MLSWKLISVSSFFPLDLLVPHRHHDFPLLSFNSAISAGLRSQASQTQLMNIIHATVP